MSWNASMIIIENKHGFSDEAALLRVLGKGDYALYSDEEVLDDALAPFDGSIHIGYFNDTIIICDDYQIIDEFISPEITPMAEALSAMFPGAEIVAATCVSYDNTHGYALIKDGNLLRSKCLNCEDFYFDVGSWLDEEKEIYADAELENDAYIWRYEYEGEKVELTEDCLMEDFCFGVAARLLGTRPDMDEGEELLNEIPFKRFWSEAAKEQSEREQAEFNDDSLDDFAVEDFIEEEDDDGKGGKRS